MGTIEADDVRRTTDECTRFLSRHVDGDWSAPVPDLEMTVGEVVAHAAEVCLWYAIDLAAGGDDLEAVQHRVETDVASGALVDTLAAYARIVAAVIETTPDAVCGFHPMGAADASGFAAMACDEMLIHTDDAARGLGLAFRPSADLAVAVLARLFPWIEVQGDPWELLRWTNGRIELDDRERLTDWAWHCAPLDQWDGSVPTRSSVLDGR